MAEKDPLSTKLRDKGKADEDNYFARRDRELLEKLKQQQTAEGETALRQQALMRCPKDGDTLVTLQQRDVTVEECPTCQGMWLDRGELETLAKHENEGWLTRLIRGGTK
ncbi:MAG: zf-TFIIB domain-containing protein [Candidatus Binatia bacterium]